MRKICAPPASRPEDTASASSKTLLAGAWSLPTALGVLGWLIARLGLAGAQRLQQGSGESLAPLPSRCTRRMQTSCQLLCCGDDG
jgi:hypothetical protein